MKFSTWRRWLSRWFPNVRSTRGARDRAGRLRTRLDVEPLEVRLTPASKVGRAAGSCEFFIVNSAADVTISGHLRDAPGVTPGGELVKDGTGTLTLTADNSTINGFSGPITVSAGTLQITNALALG